MLKKDYKKKRFGIHPSIVMFSIFSAILLICIILNVSLSNKMVSGRENEISNAQTQNYENFIKAAKLKSIKTNKLASDEKDNESQFKTNKTNVISLFVLNRDKEIAAFAEKYKNREIFVSEIKLDKTSISMEIGETKKIVATILPANATKKDLKWSSSDDKKVSVDNGTIKAIKDGKAIITVESSNGISVQCKVTVNKKVKETTATEEKKEKSNSEEKKDVKTSNGKVVSTDSNIIDTSVPVYVGKKYTLTDTQKRQLAYVAYREQGSLEGAKLELSLMANLTEESSGYSDVYDYVMNSGWFGPANTGDVPSYPEFDSDFTSEYYDAVEEVLIEGIRYLPSNVDEHDCLSDISYISTGDVYDTDAYIPYETVIHNVYGSVYTFIGFAPHGGDPFGYINE